MSRRHAADSARLGAWRVHGGPPRRADMPRLGHLSAAAGTGRNAGQGRSALSARQPTWEPMRTVSQILAGFMALPQTNVETVLGGQRALILSPHADDESLGCGGLIAAASAVGI